jgi:hypothetical protein
VSFERILWALNDVSYREPLSIEWEANGMSREQGTPEAIALVRRLEPSPSDVVFDSAITYKG